MDMNSLEKIMLMIVISYLDGLFINQNVVPV